MSWIPKKCVVVPIDFSEASETAIRTALSLVEHPRNVHVIHVISVPEFIPYGESVWLVEPKDWSAKAAQHLADYMLKHPDLKDVTCVSVEGDADAGIVRYATEQHADLIIMPCHGYRGFRRLLLGSVTAGVLRHAPCEVLVQRFTQEKKS